MLLKRCQGTVIKTEDTAVMLVILADMTNNTHTYTHTTSSLLPELQFSIHLITGSYARTSATSAYIGLTGLSLTQNKHRKWKPGLVASDDLQPGNGEGSTLIAPRVNMGRLTDWLNDWPFERVACIMQLPLLLLLFFSWNSASADCVFPKLHSFTYLLTLGLQCFDTVGWASGRASGL